MSHSETFWEPDHKASCNQPHPPILHRVITWSHVELGWEHVAILWKSTLPLSSVTGLIQSDQITAV